MVDYADKQISNFGIENLRENDKVCVTVSTVHKGGQMGCLTPKILVEILVTLYL